jgi:membrane fusion protein (multidrug efflux system)
MIEGVSRLQEVGASRLRMGLWAAAGVLLLGGVALFAAAPDSEESAALGSAAALRSVATQRIEPAQVRAVAELSGVVDARRSVRLFAETRGPVLEVGAEELDRVVEGQLLMRVDPLEAEVAVERARADVARSESELALAGSELERQRSLRKRGVSSDADLEATENARKVAVAVLRQARAELERVGDDLGKKTVVAAFDGVLRRFAVEVGEYVQPGQEIGELLDLSTARMALGVSDREVVAVREGQPIELRVEAFPGESFQGQVLRVGRAFDRETRKFPVEVEVPNPGGRLLPGMVGTAVLDLGEPTALLVIPRESAVDEFGLRFVWVIEENGQGLAAHRRRVLVRGIPFRPGELEVVEGLAAGEEIAVTAVRQLLEGEQVSRSEPASR